MRGSPRARPRLPRRHLGLEVQLEEVVVPVEGHALHDAPGQLLDLALGEALAQPAKQAPAQPLDDARMHVGGVRIDPAPDQEVRQVDHQAVVGREARARGETRDPRAAARGVRPASDSDLLLGEPGRLGERRVVRHAVATAIERRGDDDADLEVARGHRAPRA